MLHQIGLRNFKAFGADKQSAPLSKINLIYGPNSSGKSSIIQALLLLKQSRNDDWLAMHRAGRPTGRLRPRGEFVDLGSFTALVHKHDTLQHVDIDLTYDGFGWRDHTGLIKDQRIMSSMKFGFEEPDAVTDFSGLTYRVQNGSETLLNGEWHCVSSVNGDHFISASLSVGEVPVPEGLISISHTNFLPYPYVPGLIPEGGVHWAEAQSNKDFTAFRDVLERSSDPKLLEKLRTIDSSHSYDNLMNSIVYLGPLRSWPERLYPVSRKNRNDTGVRGEFTPEVLYSNRQFINSVNRWFERFGVPYTLQVDLFGTDDVTGEFVSLGLVDKRTNTKVTLADVGFGINQLLPVVVEALVPATAWSILDRVHAVICVEQPEIHLHPRLQAEVADLMIESSRGARGKQWIVETHSELFIRRVQRRIGEGELDATDVTVIYVEPGGFEGSEIHTLRLDEFGEFLDDWPDGFFEEGFNEMMAY